MVQRHFLYTCHIDTKIYLIHVELSTYVFMILNTYGFVFYYCLLNKDTSSATQRVSQVTHVLLFLLIFEYLFGSIDCQGRRKRNTRGAKYLL